MNLKKDFIELFEPTMKNKGFLRKDKVFHRIVNGKIVQLLSFYKFEGPEFTIQFSIQPLCSGDEYSMFFDGLRMCEVFRDLSSWEDESQPANLSKFLPIALEATREKLFPLFDSMTDYESYFKKRNELRPLLTFSDNVYMVHMAIGNYKLSQESRESLIKYQIDANQKRWGTDHHRVPSTQRKFEQKCEEYYRVKEAMDNNDLSYISQYILAKEQKSLNSYIKAFFSPQKVKTFLETGVLPFEFITITDSGA